MTAPPVLPQSPRVLLQRTAHALLSLLHALRSLLARLAHLLLPFSASKEDLTGETHDWLLPRTVLHQHAPPTPAPSPTSSGYVSPAPSGHRARERAPLLLHVPPSYKSLALSAHLHPAASPRPILKVRTPGEQRCHYHYHEQREGLGVGDLEAQPAALSEEGEGYEHEHERELELEREVGRGRVGRVDRADRTIRFDSVPEVRWIERAERRRSTSKTRHPKEEPSIWESWFASMALPHVTREATFSTRMRYDQMVC